MAVILLAASAFSFGPAAHWLGGQSLDLLFGARRLTEGDAPPKPSHVVVVAADEETYRRPPFADKPAAMWMPEMAGVIDALLDGGAAVIGLDVVFYTSFESLLPGYERPFLLSLRRGAREGKIVLGRLQHQLKPIEPFAAQRLVVGNDRNIRLLNALEDVDGIIRRAPLSFVIQNDKGDQRREASMALELAARRLRQAPVWFADGDLKWNDRHVTADGDDAILLNFDTRRDAIPVYSLADLFTCAKVGGGDYFAKHFRDKIVLIGTVLDVEDRKLTSMRYATRPDGPSAQARCSLPPMAGLQRADLARDSIPGVMLHATAINNLIDRTELRFLPSGWRSAALLVFCALVVAAISWLPLGLGLGAFAGLCLAWAGLSCAAFAAGFVVPVLNGLAGAVFSLTLLLAYRFAVADRSKRAIREAFALYLPPTVIDRMLEKDTPPELGGEERVVSVLFSDIAGFTRLSETLPPAELVAGLNSYFAQMTSLVEEHGGFVDKFVGDAIVAIFGAPIDDGKHADHAVRAALHMDRVMQSGTLRLGGATPIHIRIGINTGPVLIGNIGSPRRFNYTAMGDSVNLASRLEGANKMFGTRILVSDSTQQACGDRILFREIDRVRVVGRSTPVSLYEPIVRTGRRSADPRLASSEEFAAGLALWRSGQFEAAEARFAALAETDEAAAAFARRCQIKRQHPPPAWDGVTDLSEK